MKPDYAIECLLSRRDALRRSLSDDIRDIAREKAEIAEHEREYEQRFVQLRDLTTALERLGVDLAAYEASKTQRSQMQPAA